MFLLFGVEGEILKNICLMFICCILFIIGLSLTIKYKIPDRNEENEFMLKILDPKENKIFELPLEEYVWRVAAMEVPISFNDEAIKAQIVAARTYALRNIYENNHNNVADVCTDYNHCMAFLLTGEEENKLGLDFTLHCKRLKNLASQTKNQILTYENKPILAAFHATSSGLTEKSSDVWQTQLPYLINVDSSLDRNVTGYETTVCFEEDELKNIFKIESMPVLEIKTHTSAGSVKTVSVNGKSYSGTEIRKLLNLRSNNFWVEKDNDVYIFHVKGYGHGVGMSQTGANEYAKSGLTYKEILLKYYPGTTLENINKLPAT